MNSRRSFLQRALALGAAAIGTSHLFAENRTSGNSPDSKPLRHHISGLSFSVPVQTPDISNLPFTIDKDVKVFHLVAEPVKQQIAPNKVLDVWGYNGSAPGPQFKSIRATAFD